STQGDPATLATGKYRNRGLARRTPQCVHRHLKLAVDVPRVQMVNLVLQLCLLLHQRVEIRIGLRKARADHFIGSEQFDGFPGTLLDDLPDGFSFVQIGFLREIAERDALLGVYMAQEVLVKAGNDSEKRALARAVKPQNTDL